MPLAVRDIDNNIRIISVSGKFNFDLHREFRNAYIGTPENCKFMLDLRDAEYLDSSALGMILLLREYVGEDIRRLRIVNSNPEIKNILKVSNIDKIIDIQ